MNKYKREIAKALKIGRTVRRRHREAYRKRCFKYRWWYDFDDNGCVAQTEYDAEARESIRDGYWIQRAPNWWMHMEQTVPERCLTRSLLKKTLLTIDLEDAPVFPDGTKIQHGYW